MNQGLLSQLMLFLLAGTPQALHAQQRTPEARRNEEEPFGANAQNVGRGDYCGYNGVVPDATIWVPQYFVPTSVHSGSGGYFYRPTEACNAYVVDVKMGTASNTWGNPDADGELIIGGAAYDLPSSEALGFKTPIVAEDCGRLIEWITYYKKLSSETEFTRWHHATRSSYWDATELKCKLDPLDTIVATKSSTGWDTYRVAVRVKLRTSGQEAAVDLTLPQPK